MPAPIKTQTIRFLNCARKIAERPNPLRVSVSVFGPDWGKTSSCLFS